MTEFDPRKCGLDGCSNWRYHEDRFFCPLHRMVWVRFLQNNNLNKPYGLEDNEFTVTDEKIVKALDYFKKYQEAGVQKS